MSGTKQRETVSEQSKELVYFPAWTAGRRGYSDRIRELFADHVQKKGLKPTRQRQAILDFLLEANRHLSLEDVYHALRRRGIGRVTVFRTLKLLEECSLVDRVASRDGSPRFEVKFERPHHDHLICVNCGTIFEVRWPQVEKVQEKTCKEYGFEPLWHRHEIFGKCRNCVTTQVRHARESGHPEHLRIEGLDSRMRGNDRRKRK